MPAARSRTEHWRDCLHKVFERGGALEVSIDRQGPTVSGPSTDQASSGSDVVWRCRIIAINNDHIVVEAPAAFGSSIELRPNLKLIGAMTIGQNRWMFHVNSMGYTEGRGTKRHLMLSLPEDVERCARRSFYRISTADLRLPTVQCWPLLDLSSAIAAEAANREQVRESQRHRTKPMTARVTDEAFLLPEVGPNFSAQLLNLSGGGLGLVLKQSDTAALSTRPCLWLMIDLRPDVLVPIAVTARVAHTHVDSSQNLYAGMAFDFSSNPEHRVFVADTISDYIQALQSRGEGSEAIAA